MEGLIFLVAGLVGTAAFLAACATPFYLLARLGAWAGRRTPLRGLQWLLPLAFALAVLSWLVSSISAFREACASASGVQVLATIRTPPRGVAVLQEVPGASSPRTSFSSEALLAGGSFEFVDTNYNGQRRCRGAKIDERQPTYPIATQCDRSALPAVDVHLQAPQQSSKWIPLYRMPIEVRDHGTQAVLVRATEVVFGGGLVGAFMRLFGGDQDYEFLGCGYLSSEAGPWRPSLSTRPRVGDYERNDAAIVLAAHGVRPAAAAAPGLRLTDVPAVLRALSGVWSRTVTQGNLPARETLELDFAGSFLEITSGQNHVPLRRRSGTWTYDGKNFKRVVAFVDGEHLGAGNLVQETFELKSLSDHEFEVVNNSGGLTIRYTR